ncbi:MAG: DUF1653 domain-containing protein [Clostridiales bacterium]|nr:DUF1653 domain-containing protein [Candidatus Crickella merdequi]
MKTLVVRNQNYSVLTEALRYIGEELAFPSYYGCNLDALYDCLSEVREEVKFAFVYDKDIDADWLDGIAKVVGDAAAVNKNIICLNALKLGATYKHFKGNMYVAEDIAKHSEDCTDYVVYRKQYGDGGLWIRPLEMFLEEVDHDKYPEVEQKYRFEIQE